MNREDQDRLWAIIDELEKLIITLKKLRHPPVEYPETISIPMFIDDEHSKELVNEISN